MTANEKGRKAAREWAHWFIGSPEWADQILWAFQHPDEAEERLAADRADLDNPL